MKKTVCPICGGSLIIENLYQYGERQKVCKNGKIRKKVVKVYHGSIEFQYLLCADCGYHFDEDDFEYYADRVVLIKRED